MKPAKNQRGLAHITLVLVALVGIASFVGGAYFYKNKMEEFPQDASVIKEAEEKTEEKEIPEEEKVAVEKEVIEEKEEELETEPEPEPEEEKVEAGIKLWHESKDKGVHLYWTPTGINVSNGFKIVKSTDSNPTFPEDGYIYVSDSSVRNYFLGLKDGKTWHIRVCRYDGSGKCSYYSNEIVFKAPDYDDGDKSDDDDSDVDKISLSVTKKSDDKVKLTWSVDGKAKKGFKVVWSKESKPTYPGDKYHYLSDSGARSDYIDDLEEGKTYYFRVCEYLGGKCGTYSNEVSKKMD